MHGPPEVTELNQEFKLDTYFLSQLSKYEHLHL